MKRTLTYLCALLLFTQTGIAQVYVEQFDGSDAGFTTGSPSQSFSEANDELTISVDNLVMWDNFEYELNDGTMAIDADATGNNKIFVRAKASSVGTQFRMDIKDANGFVTSLPGFTRTLTTEYMVLEFDFTDNYLDAGWGGTACPVDDPPNNACPVDGTQSSQLVFFINPGQAGFSGSVVIDYIAFGTEPDEVIMSDIYQEHFDQDSSINSFTVVGQGFSMAREGTELTITGDGSNPMWEIVEYIFRTPTQDTIDIDVSGNNKMYVRVKTSVPGTALRLDFLDVDGFVTTAGSVTRILQEEYVTLEYDYTGSFQDLGFGGTPCTMDTAPCPVDATRISNIVFHLNPGEAGFLGDVTIDYISFGIPLEPIGPEAELVYEDHFGNGEVEFTGDPAGMISTEVGSDWIITGDGSAGQYAPVSYLLHDKMTGEQIFVDMGPAQNKVFLRARASQDNVPVRIDLIDTTGYVTSLNPITRTLSTEYQIFEYGFNGTYFDGGYNPDGPCLIDNPGDPTEACPVDPATITQLLVYPDPVVGGFDGGVYIDFVSIGQPIGEDAGPTGVLNYSDQMDDNTSLFISDVGGLVTTVENDVWSVAGDGTGAMFGAMNYQIHNEVGELILADAVGSNNVLYVRARSTANVDLRVDLQDNNGFVTNANGQVNAIPAGDEYVIYEYNYAGNYNDGGFGGPCLPENAPCPVDGQRVENVQLFFNPGAGLYDGTLDIDWISFGETLVGVQDISRLSAMRAFPNPVNDQLRLDYELVSGADVQLNIFNSMGQLVYQQNAGQQANGRQYATLQLGHLPAGMYVVQIATDGASAGTLRLMKQ